MKADFYSLAMLLEREKIGYSDDERTALIAALADENNQ